MEVPIGLYWKPHSHMKDHGLIIWCVLELLIVEVLTLTDRTSRKVWSYCNHWGCFCVLAPFLHN